MKTVELETAEMRRVKRSERSEKYQEPEPGSGLFGSIQRILGTTVAVVHSRIELLTVEMKELKGRAVALLFWAAALLFLGFLTFVAIMATVVFAFWDQALPVLAGFSAFFVVLAIASFSFAKAKLSQIPFKETVDQLKKDRHLVVHEKNWDEED